MPGEGAAVSDDQGGPSEQVGLRDEALDAHAGRYSAEGGRVDVWPDGRDGIDVKFTQRRNKSRHGKVPDGGSVTDDT